MRLADMLDLPKGIEALILDMDGVILDTLGADHGLAVEAARRVVGEGGWVSRETVRRHFALEPVGFWEKLCEAAPQSPDAATKAKLVDVYNDLRTEAAFDLLPGIVAVIDAAAAAGLKLAVASSNAEPVVRALIDRAGLTGRFAAVSGIVDGAAGKPAPDIYRRALDSLGVAADRAAFVEDSLTGLEAGRAAGIDCAVAVATGATTFEALEASDRARVVYDRFARPRLSFVDGRPTEKRIDTPNDFVSHMVEHIAWRLGTGINLAWRSNDWAALGRFLGEGLRAFDFATDKAASLGMIDDGAAEVLIDRTAPPGLDFSVHPSLPEEQVLAMRVEQVRAGRELVAIARGIAEGFGARKAVSLCAIEATHQSWEGD